MFSLFLSYKIVHSVLPNLNNKYKDDKANNMCPLLALNFPK